MEQNQLEDFFKHQSLFAQAKDGVFIVDNGNVIETNSSFRDMLGYTSREISQFKPKDWNLIFSGQEYVFSGLPITSKTFNTQIRRKNGAFIDLEISSNPVEWYGKRLFLYICRNVTKRLILERALRESKEALRQVVENAKEMISVLGFDGKFILINSAGVKAFGKPLEKIVGQTLWDLWPAEYADERFDLIKQIQELEQGVEMEGPILLRGAHRWFLSSLQPMWNASGEVVAVLAIEHDVHDRKTAEEALKDSHERLKLVSARLAEVQEKERQTLAKELHDRIGQNLTLLGININLIRGQMGSELSENTSSQFDTALKLIDEISDHIRGVMSELYPPVLEEYGLAAAFQWFADRLHEQTGLQVEIAGGLAKPQLPTAVNIALFRIVQEALTNIVKHSGVNKATVTLEDLTDVFTLTIADTGKGFDPSRMPANGDAHWGLLTMRERAEAVNGSLQIESFPGVGTKIIVKVPK